MQPNPDEAAIAEFHRAARKRKAWIFAIAGVFSLIAGVIALVISFSVEPMRPGETTRIEVKVILLGALLVVGGLGSLYNAYRIGSGEVDDVD